MAKLRANVSLLLLALAELFLMESVSAMTHIVGSNHGWRVPETPTYFADWAKPRTFGVGDQLVFPYRPGLNNVVVVNKEDFDSCNMDTVIYMYHQGPTTLNLTSTGDHYYYCGIGKHCEVGQKLHITVAVGEGKSGSDPLPFKLDTLGLNGSSAPAPAHAAKSSASGLKGLSLSFGLFTMLAALFI